MLEGRTYSGQRFDAAPSPFPSKEKRGAKRTVGLTVEKGFWGSELTSKKEFPFFVRGSSTGKAEQSSCEIRHSVAASLTFFLYRCIYIDTSLL